MTQRLMLIIGIVFACLLVCVLITFFAFWVYSRKKKSSLINKANGSEPPAPVPQIDPPTDTPPPPIIVNTPRTITTNNTPRSSRSIYNRTYKITDKRCGSVDAYLLNWELTRQLIRGDGACQFRAVADQMQYVLGEKTDHAKLREQAVDAIQEASKESNNVMLLAVIHEGDGDYFESMRQQNMYGDNLTLQALSSTLNVCIVVISPTGVHELKPDALFAGGSTKQPKERSSRIVIVYESAKEGDNEHYNSTRSVAPRRDLSHRAPPEIPTMAQS